MNIWCISKYASVPSYGPGARLFYLAKEFIRQGHQATLITSDANHLARFPATKHVYNDEEIEGVPVHWLKTRKYKKSFSVARVFSWLDFERRLFFLDVKKVGKPDVVIVSSLSIFSIIYGLYLKRKFKIFLVFEIRDIWPLTMTEEAGFSKWHPLVLFIGFLEKIGYKHADLIVGTMPKLDIHVQKQLGYSRPFFCSPLGFDRSSYSHADDAEGLDFFANDVPQDKIIVGYAGSMGVTNALEPYINVISSFKNHPKLYFVLLGGGDLKLEFEQRLSDCNNVAFFPRIPQSKVKNFLKICDIVYLATKDSKVWDYGQSMNKIVEYMLAGKPIVASYTGFPSMINEAGCGKFVSPSGSETAESKLKDVLLEFTQMTKEERRAMGQKGKKWIQDNRNYERLATDYMNKIADQMARVKK